MSTRIIAAASVIGGEVAAWVDPGLGGAAAAASLAAAVMSGRAENDTGENAS